MLSRTCLCQLAHLPAMRPHFRILVLLSIAAVFLAPAFTQSDRDVRSYLEAITQLQSENDLAPLEHFVASAPDGSLRNDALEWLAWREWRSGAMAKADHWSDELLAGNPQNAVGLAVLASRSAPSAA